MLHSIVKFYLSEPEKLLVLDVLNTGTFLEEVRVLYQTVFAY